MGALDDTLGSRSAEGSAHNGQQAAGTGLFGRRLAVDSIAHCSQKREHQCHFNFPISSRSDTQYDCSLCTFECTFCNEVDFPEGECVAQ